MYTVEEKKDRNLSKWGTRKQSLYMIRLLKQTNSII